MPFVKSQHTNSSTASLFRFDILNKLPAFYSTPTSTGAAEDLSKGIAGMPKHVAIIMDGNRRWAQTRNLPKILGHKAGVDALERIILAASKMGKLILWISIRY